MSNKPTQKHTTNVSMVSQEFSGPLPPPAVLDDYNRVVPSAAEKIIAMAEKEQEHRIKAEQMMIEGEIKQAKRGQIMGFIIALLLTATAIYLAVIGLTSLSAIIFSVTLIGVATIFVLNKKPRR